MALSDLEPKALWAHFFSICAIPHPSHHEEALAESLEAWAKAQGLEAQLLEAHNLVIRKPATPGHEEATGVILQAHLDMVPQAVHGSAHDFLKDPILPRPSPGDHDWLGATGTTLGADNGIGLAMALGILEDRDLVHGPLECLFTTNEEDGMSGARALGPKDLRGTILLNLDGEDEGELTIGCAGAIRTAATLAKAAEATSPSLHWFKARVGGLLGGHSGVDIDKGRANASLALAEILARCGIGIRLAGLEGGTAANAIPREAWALLGTEAEPKELTEAFHRAAHNLGLHASEPGFEAQLEAVPPPAQGEALSLAASAEVLELLQSLPNGLVAMEPAMPGLIRTSLNLGRLSGKLEGGDFVLSTLVMIRSSSDVEKEDLGARVEETLAGAQARGWRLASHRPSVTPAWQPDPSSPLLAKARAAFAATHGHEPKVTSTHGGLECGLFRPAFPDWDMVSLGPTIRFPHSPDEAVEIGSVGRCFAFLKVLLTNLA